MDIRKFETEWGGKPLIIETGHYAQRSNGTCTVQYGDSVVLATAVIAKTPRENIDFFPLMVDYEERLYASGKIKSSRFIKREGRPNDEAVMTGRMIDRVLRPLFPSKVRHEVQVVLEVLSADLKNDTDMPAMLAASCALAMSDIPWDGPVAGVRVGRVDGQMIVNPTFQELEKSDMDVVVAGTPERVLMLEANAKQVPEDDMYDAIMFAQQNMGPALELVNKVVAELGKEKLNAAALAGEDPDETEEQKQEMAANMKKAEEFLSERLPKVLFSEPTATKSGRAEALGALKHECDEYLKEQQIGKEKRKKILDGYYGMIGAAATKAILEEDKRVDGRKLNEVRPLVSQVDDLLPRPHGAGMFMRGETQVLSVVTLGGPGDAQILDGMDQPNLRKRYMHHYYFPPFSCAETGRLGGSGRREIGHGGLAERALIPVLPSKEDFPYVIRVVSEVLSSNGSSSQASICGSTLALMDAGVPIAEPVAGIAMGLASNADMSQWKVLTDIQDVEDGEGGMDFKIGGTKHGVNTIQLDTKTIGLTPDIIRQTLDQGREARLHILGEMAKAIAEPRADLKPHAPRIVSLKIDVDKIRDVIGPGGKTINEITTTCEVSMDVEDDGTVTITSANRDGLNKAVKMVRNLTRQVEVGEMFEGKVVRIMDFGAFVELTPNQDGMVHISDLAPWHVNKVTDIVQMGDVIPVKVVKIDELGRINLSHKEAMKELGREQTPPAGYTPRPPRSDRPPFRGGGGRPHGHGGGFGGGRPPHHGGDRGPRH